MADPFIYVIIAIDYEVENILPMLYVRKLGLKEGK